jgi:hypothetical protein
MGNSEAVGGALKHPFVLGSSFSQKLVNNVRETVTTWKGIPLSPQLGEVPNGKKSVLIFAASRKLGKTLRNPISSPLCERQHQTTFNGSVLGNL